MTTPRAPATDAEFLLPSLVERAFMAAGETALRDQEFEIPEGLEITPELTLRIGHDVLRGVLERAVGDPELVARIYSVCAEIHAERRRGR